MLNVAAKMKLKTYRKLEHTYQLIFTAYDAMRYIIAH